MCVRASNAKVCKLGQSVKTHKQQKPYIKHNKTSIKHIQTSYFQISTKTHNPRNLGLEMWNTLRKRQNPYLFLKIGEEWERIWRFCVWKRWFWKRERGTRRWIVTRCEGKMKSFKTVQKKTLIVQNMRFSWLNRVANKLLGQVAKHLRDKNFEKFV